MISIRKKFSLKELNSFGVNAIAEEYIRITETSDLQDLISQDLPDPYIIIGEGSNILFSNDFKASIIHPVLKGIRTVHQDDQFIDIEAKCGENWDSFVAYCCDHNYTGIENLSLIPGSVGSAPVQNIGAYGVEVKDFIRWVEGVDLKTGETRKLNIEECNFGYRTSIFKTELLNRFLITSVTFRLLNHPRFNLRYGNVEDLFKQKKKKDILSLRETIIEIRNSKLPNPAEYGNAGSFFKNPVISVEKFSSILDKFPSIPSYPAEDKIKIPAAWLIEKAGWKGIREENVGTWPAQPLVIVNYGDASGSELFRFSEKIRKAVDDQFGINLEREVTII